MTFSGFPEAALDFYDDLELDNTKSFWDANKHIYLESVRQPMLALVEALSDEFSSVTGKSSVFRPYRDVRFSRDKLPYKTHQGAFVAVAPETGYYVEISPRGVRTGGGCYWFAPPRLAAFRAAIDHDTYGPELATLLRSAKRKGFEVGGEKLKTRPRGYDVEHPRIDLLRHKTLTLGRMIGFEPVIHSADLVAVVRKDWRAVRPTTEWIERHAGA